MKATINLRIFSVMLLLLFTGSIFFQCDDLFKKHNDDDNDTNIADGSYIVTNSSDPEFIKLVTENNEIINVFGTRDATGLPRNVEQINITLDNGQEYQFFFNSDKQLKTVIADNGTVFNYEWLNSNKVALFIDCNDGVNQINTEIDLTELETGKSAVLNNNALMREPGDFCYDIEFTPFSDANEVDSGELLKSAAGYGTTYDLHTTSCGAPSNQNPYAVYLYDQSGSVLLKELYAEYVAKGHYKIIVPAGTAPTIDPQAAVEKLTAILSPICDAAGIYGAVLSPAACAYIAAKLALTGIGTTVAPAVGTACAGITAALSLYCATLGASGPPGSPSIMDKINEQKLLENFKLTGNMRLHVKFHGLPKSITKAFTIAEGIPAVLNAELSENAKPSIRSLDLSPSSPAANQNYTISVSVFCVPVGSSISISMVGTDGYTQNSEYVVADASESAGTFKMTVLGAESGVRDEITVVVRTPDGQNITRSASLIFGD
ncbi:MAG: hypothetical protein R2757_06745 [Draconibacterium sp.]